MVRVTQEDLVGMDIPEEEQADLLQYLSEDSDADEDSLTQKLQAFEPLVQMEDRFPSTVIITGIPKVGADRLAKLTAVMRKKISAELVRKGSEDKDGIFSIELPMAADASLSRGCCFLTFPSVYAAQHAARSLTGYKLDLRHTFRAALLDDFDEIVQRDQDYKPSIKLRGFTREDVRWWLNDARFREQFCLRYANETEVHWIDPMEREVCSLCYDGHREKQDGKAVWTDFRVQWSPQGSYLATFHRQGVALWAGKDFEKKVRLEHKEVKQIQFSPCETYMLSWDGSPASMRSEKAVKTWNVMTGEMLRQFATPAASPRGTEFPHFLFSHDEKYLAKIGDRELCVYVMDPKDNQGGDPDATEDLTPMKLLRDENGHFSALKYPVEKFEWSPADNVVSLWLRGSDDAPGRLILVEVPSRRELASKNVYNVKGAAMHWQSRGDFLCLRTLVSKKTGKKGRKEFTQLEIFRMREKDIPVDNLQLNDIAMQLHWEEGPSKRFALVVQEEATNNQSLRFFSVADAVEGNLETNKRDTVLTHSFEISNYMNFLKWSPFGSYFILASLGFEGTLMFCHLNEQDKVEVLHQDEHYMCNEVKWSDCGRYLSTSVVLPLVSAQSFRLEEAAGFSIWTFQGKLLERAKKKQFYQFLWRPHPPSLLSEKQIDQIRKKMKDYSKRYEGEDERLRNERRQVYIRQRREECDKFQQIVDEMEAWKAQHPLAEEWRLAEEEFAAYFEWELKEDVFEEELDVRQEIIS